MKFRISLAVNIVLLVVLIALGCRMLSITIGDFYYRKMVGGLAAGAVSELDKGHVDLVRQALALIPSDPDELALIAASKKVGVMK
jgi:uncharacterized Tic20 family protein